METCYIIVYASKKGDELLSVFEDLQDAQEYVESLTKKYNSGIVENGIYILETKFKRKNEKLG